VINFLRKIDWLVMVIYPLAVILMEAFWLYPLLVWVGFWPMFAGLRPVLSFISIVIVLAISLTITRVVTKRDWPMGMIQFIVVGAGLVTMFFVLRIDYGGGYSFTDGGWFAHVGEMFGATFDKPYTVVLAVPVLIYLWWRGIQLGRTTSYFANIYRSFVIGMIALIILIIFWQVSSQAEDIEGPISDIGLYVIAFFFFGLIALSVCHMYVMRQRMPAKDTVSSVWRSLPIMLGVIGGIIVIGFVTASLLSSDFFNTVGNALGVVGDALYTAFMWVMEKLNFIFEGIFWVIRWFLSLLRAPEQQEMEGPPGGGPFEDVEVNGIEIPEIFTTIFQWVVIAAIVALVIYILARAIKRYLTRQRPEEIEEIHESLWSTSSLRDDLRQFLNMLGNRFRRKPKKAGISYDDTPGRLNVRDIYRRLLWETSRQGITRRNYETPVEYERRLEKYVPEGAEQLAGITDLYSEVRYGDIEPREEKVDNANGLWTTLRGMIRRMTGS
jgi:hypothetical protein